MHTLALFYGLPEVENGGNSQKVSGIFWVLCTKKNVDFPSFFLSLFLLSELQYRVVKSHFYGKKLAFMTLNSFFALFNYYY